MKIASKGLPTIKLRAIIALVASTISLSIILETIISGHSTILPIGGTILNHVFIEPKDMYKPIVLDDSFRFHELGYEKRYHLSPKYYPDKYEIGIDAQNGGIDHKYKFTGRIKVGFFWRDKLLSEEIISSWRSAVFMDKDMTRFNAITLLTFSIPFESSYIDDISVNVQVLEQDRGLEQYKDRLKLYVRVSAIP